MRDLQERLAGFSVVIVLLVTLGMLGAGYAAKARCLEPQETRGRSFHCTNDLQVLYGAREVDERVFPYIDGRIAGTLPVDGAIEYPVLTGLVMWAAGQLVENQDTFFQINAILLAAAALLTAFLLARLVGLRALLWAAAPPVAFWTFHNWDVLAVLATVTGVYLWWRGRPVAAAAAFAVGAAFKLYPIVFLAPLAAERWVRGDRRGAGGVMAAGVGVWAAVNVPFALLGFEGWWATYRFHQVRLPNPDSTWILGLPNLTASDFNRLSAAGTLIGLVAVLVYAWRRGRDGAYPFLATCGALLAVLMLFGKVQSPQYTLWILPFFALLDVALRWWLAYLVVDGLVWLGVFDWAYARAQQSLSAPEDEIVPRADQLVVLGVWGRAFLLVLLIGIFLRASPAMERRTVGADADLLEAPVRQGETRPA